VNRFNDRLEFAAPGQFTVHSGDWSGTVAPWLLVCRSDDSNEETTRMVASHQNPIRFTRRIFGPIISKVDRVVTCCFPRQ
jgi:hypothetical protein